MAYSLIDVAGILNRNREPFTKKDVPQDHQWTYAQRGMDFTKNLNLSGKYCYHPFNTITVDLHGDVYMCTCQATLPISVGKIWDFDSLTSIAQCNRSRELQASILDGTYKYCDHTGCGIIQNDELSNKIYHRTDTINWINFAVDNSCNLTCPSCRSEFKFIKNGPEFDLRIKIIDHLISLIEKHDHWIKFSIANDGDPFASLVYRHLLSNLKLTDESKVEIEIITNGIMAKDHWHKMAGVHKHIVRYKVSFDAGSESVYNVTRRGGDWNKFIEGVKFIVKWKQKNYSNMNIMANFVVQQANYKDMISYSSLCEELGITEIYFQKITDWGTFANFKKEAVWHTDHPEFNDFIPLLREVAKNKKVNLSNLVDLLK